jgi:sialate O-acetylesterase
MPLSVSLPWATSAIVQRDTILTIAGQAQPEEIITVLLNDSLIGSAKTNRTGTWQLTLGKQQAGGPHSLTVRTSNKEQLLLTDIWFGDVWLISGQSNMEWKLGWGVDGGEETIKNTNNPMIRVLEIPNIVSAKPENQFPDGPKWKVATPDNMAEFSAIGFYFAALNQESLEVPIGIIDATWGGTPAEAWTPIEALTTIPFYEGKAKKYLDPTKDWEAEMALNDTLTKKKWAMIGSAELGLVKGAHLPSFDDSDWQEISFPTKEVLTDAVWLRKEIYLEELPTDTVYLETGNVSQEAFYYLNGTEIGRKSWQTSEVRFAVDPKILVKGPNILSFRAVNSWDNNVIIASIKPIQLIFPNNGITSLNNNWKVRTSVEPPIPEIKRYEFEPAFLFNAMIHPLKKASFKGVLWYQGESNVADYQAYESLFSSLITAWRDNFNRPSMPFIFAQLAAYQEAKDEPSDDDWVRLQEAQSKVALSLANTAMVVLNDIGDANDIHPRNKKEAARRFWLQVNKMVYDSDDVASGPIYKSHEIINNTISLQFSAVGAGLNISGNGNLSGFSIAGSDSVFMWASEAKIIDKNTIEVSHPKIKKPLSVRYAWSSNPTKANLVNSVGLPASTFRLDKWKIK